MLSTAYVLNYQNSESKSEVGPKKKLPQSEAVKSQQATLRGHFQEDKRHQRRLMQEPTKQEAMEQSTGECLFRSHPNQKPWNSWPQSNLFANFYLTHTFWTRFQYLHIVWSPLTWYVLVEHALHMRSVVWHLYDSWPIHIRRKSVHGCSKMLGVKRLGHSVQVRVILG